MFRLKTIEEPDIDLLIEKAGGRRISYAETRADEGNPDYLCGTRLLELKLLHLTIPRDYRFVMVLVDHV